MSDMPTPKQLLADPQLFAVTVLRRFAEGKGPLTPNDAARIAETMEQASAPERKCYPIMEVEEIIDGLSPLALEILFRLGSFDDDFGYRKLEQIASSCGADVEDVTAALTELLNLDLVDYSTELATEDGEPFGAGYARYEDGDKLLNIFEALRYADGKSNVLSVDQIEAIKRNLINTPETADFMAGVPIEAAHQRERWPSAHDEGKSPFDWFWLIGYLAQKAAVAAVAGDTDKAKHHTISTGAALANWHAALTGASTVMRPGTEAFTFEGRSIADLADYPMDIPDNIEPILFKSQILQAMTARYRGAVPGLSDGDAFAAAVATWETEWPDDPGPRTMAAALEVVDEDLTEWVP